MIKKRGKEFLVYFKGKKLVVPNFKRALQVKTKLETLH